MRATAIERIRAFEHRFTRAQATGVVEFPWGYAVLQCDFPLSHYHNRVVVTAPANAQDVLDAADRVLAGLSHRYVSVHDDAAGTALVPAFVAAGYDHEVIVPMAHSGPPVPPPAYDVDEVSVDTLRPALVHDWRLLLPDASDAQIAQLADRTALYGRAAEAVLLAVFDDGLLAAHADLFLDRGAAVAQFEHLATRNEYQGRGHGTALVHDALRRSAAARCDLVFLTADLDDWPREWYGRLNFTEVDRTHHFERN